MSQPQTPDEFDSLRRLLALKRREIPPPGYFQNFSARVIARIEATQMAPPLPWWRRWLQPATGEGLLNLSNAMTFAGLALVAGTLFMVVSGRQSKGALPQTAGLGASPLAVAGVTGVPEPSMLSPSPITPEMIRITLTPVEISTNDTPPPGLFSVPSLHRRLGEPAGFGVPQP